MPKYLHDFGCKHGEIRVGWWLVAGISLPGSNKGHLNIPASSRLGDRTVKDEKVVIFVLRSSKVDDYWLYINKDVYIYICIYICKYIYLYVYIYMYIYM